MADYVHNYLSFLQSHFIDIASGYEQHCWDADNGELTTVKEGRDIAVSHVDQEIQNLQTLRDDLRNLSWKKLTHKYGF